MITALITAIVMAVHPAPRPIHHDDGIATAQQIQQQINTIDPAHTIDWRMTITNGYQSGDVFGVALPWYGIIMLQADALPTANDLYKGIIVHEWSHVLQYRWVGSTPYNFLLLEQKLNSYSHDQYGIETMDDCMVKVQTGIDYFQTCHDPISLAYAVRALIDLRAGRTYQP